jgi:hypothetical protein
LRAKSQLPPSATARREINSSRKETKRASPATVYNFYEARSSRLIQPNFLGLEPVVICHRKKCASPTAIASSYEEKHARARVRFCEADSALSFKTIMTEIQDFSQSATARREMNSSGGEWAMRAPARS